MTNPSPEALARLRALLRVRRIGACETPPCAEYQPRDPSDYGVGSCVRCGWSEPEHIIDLLVRTLPPATAETERTMKQYPCGCSASGGLLPLPDYCPMHEKCPTCGNERKARTPAPPSGTPTLEPHPESILGLILRTTRDHFGSAGEAYLREQLRLSAAPAEEESR